jgi:hypothetical protein
MTLRQTLLCEWIKRLGYKMGNQAKLYGMRFHLISDPFCIANDLVVVDTEELKSGKKIRVRLPSGLVRIAHVEIPQDIDGCPRAPGR